MSALLSAAALGVVTAMTVTMIARIDVRRSLRIVGDRDWFIVEAVRIVVGKSGTRLIRIVFSPLNYAKFCNFAETFHLWIYLY